MGTKKILVTGGAGYIGDLAVQMLLNLGHEVTVLDKLVYTDAYRRTSPRLNFVGKDLFEFDRYDEFDAIIHLAAIVGDGACAVDPIGAARINTAGTHRVVSGAREDAKVVYASTCSVYGKCDGLVTLETPTNPLSVYAQTKLAGEEFMRKQDAVLRLGTLYGMSGDFGRLRWDLVANILTARAVNGESLCVFGGQQYRPLLSVYGAALAFVDSALHNHLRGIYNVVEGNYTIAQLAEHIAFVLESTMRIKVDLRYQDIPFEDQRNYRVRLSDERSMLVEGDFRETIYEMAKFIAEGRVKDYTHPTYNNAKFMGAQ